MCFAVTNIYYTVQTMNSESSVCFRNISGYPWILSGFQGGPGNKLWSWQMSHHLFKAHPPTHLALLLGKVIPVTVSGFENTWFPKPSKKEKLQLSKIILHYTKVKWREHNRKSIFSWKHNFTEKPLFSNNKNNY